MRRAVALVVMFAVVLAVAALVVPMESQAKPGGNRPPQPCLCPPTTGDCTLVSCGQFDCVYQCPFP